MREGNEELYVCVCMCVCVCVLGWGGLAGVCGSSRGKGGSSDGDCGIPA